MLFDSWGADSMVRPAGGVSPHLSCTRGPSHKALPRERSLNHEAATPAPHWRHSSWQHGSTAVHGHCGLQTVGTCALQQRSTTRTTCLLWALFLPSLSRQKVLGRLYGSQFLRVNKPRRSSFSECSVRVSDSPPPSGGSSMHKSSRSNFGAVWASAARVTSLIHHTAPALNCVNPEDFCGCMFFSDSCWDCKGIDDEK